ncbi:MAG: hypothetical protein BYD32DRAFT_413959 [Podila humilis]|nr:MAG: hypothetical protein BYD32DRAFT_413959 [Podila humilis]
MRSYGSGPLGVPQANVHVLLLLLQPLKQPLLSLQACTQKNSLEGSLLLHLLAQDLYAESEALQPDSHSSKVSVQALVQRM